MQEYFLGRTSEKRLSTCHPKIQLIVRDMIKHSRIDVGVICGFRGKEDQEKAFDDKVSKAHWGQSPHNFMWGDKPCSLAVDLAAYSDKIKNYLWNDEESFQILKQQMMNSANKFGVKLKWGGDFTNFKDMPHFEIVI
jgi:peptidoglycan L-alanyl-D-glutamate endopeptidase CwlK